MIIHKIQQNLKKWFLNGLIKLYKSSRYSSVVSNSKKVMKAGLDKHKEKDDYMIFEVKKLMHEVQRLG